MKYTFPAIALLTLTLTTFAKSSHEALIVCEGNHEMEETSSPTKFRVFTNDDFCKAKVGSTVRAYLSLEDTKLDMEDFFPVMIEGTKKYLSKTQASYRFVKVWNSKKDETITFKVNENEFYETEKIKAKSIHHRDAGALKKEYVLNCIAPKFTHDPCSSEK